MVIGRAGQNVGDSKLELRVVSDICAPFGICCFPASAVFQRNLFQNELSIPCFDLSEPEYNSSLFLDCCGLVRQVLRDLSSDFGFRVGPWNQAYQYDTLPHTLSGPSEAQPGDLVFIAAQYYNAKGTCCLHSEGTFYIMEQ